MDEKKPENRGRLIKKVSVRPAVEVDCSNWTSDVPTGARIVGRLVKKVSVRPAIEVDCSGWSADPPVTLELTVGMDPAVNALELAFGLLDLLGVVNRLERNLGGTGLTKVGGRQSDGTVILSLMPDGTAGAVARVRQVCDALNQVPQPPELPLPAVVKTITARVG